MSAYYDELDEGSVGNESLYEGRFDYFISGPIESERCTIDENILQIHNSFGYDCSSKLFNICAADDHSVVYAAGSYIIVFNTNDSSLTFRKCIGNGGIGHITKNPVSGHLAVGENSDDPLIIVYKWPTFDIVSVLRTRIKGQCNWLNFSQDGNILCSQGGEPDNTLTIWDWKRSKIILRTKSHTQDVYVCRFSEFIPGHLVTAGAGHIKFWRMEKTFTGLKLLGQLGRFGKTEISDVIGTFSMDDEKIISGCEWGNILVWDEGLIDVELTRKNRVPCHSAPIIMFLYSEHATELISVSMDGSIKGWYYQAVREANPPDEDRVVEIDPSFLIKVQDAAGVAKIMGMCKIKKNPESHDYFVQDGNGGIWLVDIKVAADAKRPKRLVKFHGDSITSLQTSPIGYFIATTSLDGWFHVYDVVGKKLIFAYNFKVPITSSVWLPFKTTGSGNVFAIGFRTGILKTVTVPLGQTTAGDEPPKLFEIQSSKPHTGNISHLTVDRGVKVLVCGSDDCTIFVYRIEIGPPITLKPIGMYPLPGKVNHIHWKPSEKRIALISCNSGHIVEVNVPKSRPLYTKQSFQLTLESRVIQTVSVKSELLRDQRASEVIRRKQEKLARKKESLNVLRENNPGVEIDEEFYLQDSDEEEILPEIFVPSTPGSVLFAVYTPSENTVWASIDGYDVGYLYEYGFDTPKPINATAIPGKLDTQLTAMQALQASADNDSETVRLTLLMGFADGRVRVTNVSVDDTFDLSDYIEYPTHDNKSGRVKTLCFSRDNRMLYTYGDDGNIFSFMFNCDIDVIKKEMVPISKLPPLPNLIEESIIKTKENLKFSLEEIKMAKEKRKMFEIAFRRKEKVKCLLFNEKEKCKRIVTDSKLLSLAFPREYFQLDEKFSILSVKEARSKAKKLRLKLALDHEKSVLGLQKVNYFDVRGINTKLKVKGILEDKFVKTLLNSESHYSIFHGLLEELISKKRPIQQQRKSPLIDKTTDDLLQKSNEKEIFLRRVYQMYSSLPMAIRYVIDKFRSRLDYEKNVLTTLKQIRQEKSLLADEQPTSKNDGKTLLAPKTNSNLPGKQSISMEDKFEEFMYIIDEMENLKSVFNETVVYLRDRKISIIRDYKQLNLDISLINQELDDQKIMTPSDFPVQILDEAVNICCLDSKHLSPGSEINESSKLHPTESIFIKEQVTTTHIKTTIWQLMNEEKLKYRHACLHESMLRKVNVFDEHISTIEAMRKDQLLAITFMELFSLSLKEELMILRVFDLIQDEFKYNTHLHYLKQHSINDEIMSLQEDIRYCIKRIDEKKFDLIEIQKTFDMEVRNKWFANYLARIFRKKYKPPKINVNRADDDSDSSSSSDESDSESEEEVVKNQSSESITVEKKIVVFDENVKPEGCEQQLFELTFELRSKRHGIEQDIQQTKNKLDQSYKKLTIANAEKDFTKIKLEQTMVELETFQVEKSSKLNKVKTTVNLNKNRVLVDVPLEDAILFYAHILLQTTNSMNKYRKEMKDLNDMCENEKLQALEIFAEKKKLIKVFKNLKEILKEEITKKFKTETDWSFLDDMEMAIIDFMILKYRSHLDTHQRVIFEFKKAIRALEQKQTKLLKDQNCKLNKLFSIRKKIQGILSLQSNTSDEKVKISHQNIRSGTYSWYNNIITINVDDDFNTMDDVTLKKNWHKILDVYKTLLKRKQDVSSKIFALLQRDEVSNTFLPKKETIEKVLEYVNRDSMSLLNPSGEHHYSEEFDHRVFDQMMQRDEQHNAEELGDEVVDEMAQIAEHHVSEGKGKYVLEETLPNIKYYDAVDLEEDFFDNMIPTTEIQFADDMYEDDLFDEMVQIAEHHIFDGKGKTVLDKTSPNAEYYVAENLEEDVFDNMIPTTEKQFADDMYEDDVFDEMVQIAEHHVFDGKGKNVLDKTSPNAEYYVAENLEEDVFDNTILSAEKYFADKIDEDEVFNVMPQITEQYFSKDLDETKSNVQRQIVEDFGEEVVGVELDGTRDDWSVSNESVRNDSMSAEHK